MTNSQRLDDVEDELETVKRLLVSTATYAESANRRLDELTIKQDRTQSHLDQLGVRVDQIGVRVDQIGARVDQLSLKLDSFVTHTQRLFTRAGGEIEETKARTERLEALMLKLDRNFEEQKSQFQEFQRTTSAALERIDRVLDYLFRQQGDNPNSPS
ncbi:6-aminohexanoate hydrolase [Nostoc sp. CHAB 5844]|nr:6-aminohexanoate hydrolase [Nostoc sp. CHAB 5844]